MSLLQTIMGLDKTSCTLKSTLVKWFAHRQGWVTLNTDTFLQVNPDIVDSIGVIRDHLVHWICVFL